MGNRNRFGLAGTLPKLMWNLKRALCRLLEGGPAHLRFQVSLVDSHLAFRHVRFSVRKLKAVPAPQLKEE